jgi:hypothetical protein
MKAAAAGPAWFETALSRLLTMRVEIFSIRPLTSS